jgi:hypothetical protein
MRHRNQLPPNYQKLLDFAVTDLGITFTDRADNVKLIADHMGWQPRAVHAILGILTKNGVLAWNRKARAWTVVQGGQKVA